MAHFRIYNAQLLIPQTYELFLYYTDKQSDQEPRSYNETCILVLSYSYLFDNGMF